MEPYYFMLPGFRVTPSKSLKSTHWMGGEPFHANAKCDVCKRPYGQLWCIDCSDPKIPALHQPDFSRLSLYFCWTCGNDFYYEIGDRKGFKFKGYASKREPSSDFPYTNYPKVFDRIPIGIQRIPYEVEKCALLVLGVMGEGFEDSLGMMKPWMTASDRRELSAYYGRDVESPLDMRSDQLGGLPYLIQGAETIACPSGCTQRMRVLATVYSNPKNGLPMLAPREHPEKNNPFAQVVFHICPSCYCIHAGNRCD